MNTGCSLYRFQSVFLDASVLHVAKKPRPCSTPLIKWLLCHNCGSHSVCGWNITCPTPKQNKAVRLWPWQQQLWCEELPSSQTLCVRICQLLRPNRETVFVSVCLCATGWCGVTRVAQAQQNTRIWACASVKMHISRQIHWAVWLTFVSLKVKLKNGCFVRVKVSVGSKFFMSNHNFKVRADSTVWLICLLAAYFSMCFA